MAVRLRPLESGLSTSKASHWGGGGMARALGHGSGGGGHGTCTGAWHWGGGGQLTTAMGGVMATLGWAVVLRVYDNPQTTSLGIHACIGCW